MPYITETDLAQLGHDLSGVNVAGICQRAEAMVDGEIGQPVLAKTSLISVTVNKQGRMFVVTPNFLPIISVEYIRLYKPDLSMADVTGGFIFTDGGSILFPPIVCDLSLPAAIRYKHGYELEDIPADIKQAALIVAKALLDDVKATAMAGLGGVTSVSDNGRSVSTSGAAIQVPQPAKDLLAEYRRVR